MTLAQTASVLAFLAGLTGLWGLCVAWRNYRLDRFRQNLFAIRDDLFDYAAAGNVSFNDPAYWRLRLLMNSLIRYGHHVNLTCVVMPMIASQLFTGRNNPNEGPYAAWRAAVAKCPTDVQVVLLKTQDRVNEAASTQLIVVSPLSLPLLVLWFLVPQFKVELKARIRHVEDEAVRADEIRGAVAA